MNKSAPSTSGQQSETLAAEWLAERGFKIVERNWRNRWCEIDIVARKGDAIHFVEVKYRATAEFGSGFEYITTEKQQRLMRAAEMWMSFHKTLGQYHIDAISVVGDIQHPQIDYLENVVIG